VKNRNWFCFRSRQQLVPEDSKWPQQRTGFQRCVLMDLQTKTCRRCSRAQQLGLSSVECGALAEHKQTAIEWKHGIDREAHALFYRWKKSRHGFFAIVAQRHVHKFDLQTRGLGSSMEGLVHVKPLFFSRLMEALCMQKMPPYRAPRVLQPDKCPMWGGVRGPREPTSQSVEEHDWVPCPLDE
jgi:hypothetical protein